MRVYDPNNPSEFEQYLRHQIDIVDVVAEYVHLTGNGNIYRGACPFHSADAGKKLSVNRKFKCFRCGGCLAWGDAFDFTARIRGISRPEAVRLLADKQGIKGNLLGEELQTRVKREHVTFSVLKHFLQCPLRYKYKHIDHKEDQKTTPYLAMGRLVHTIMAEFFKGSEASRSIDGLLDILDRRWGTRNFPGAEEARAHVEEMLTSYYRNHDCRGSKSLVEERIECKVGGLIIAGVVDRIDELPEGELEIIDYKTEPLDTSEDSVNAMQLALYYYGVTERFDLPVTKLTLEYLPSQQCVSVPATKQEMESQFARVAEIARQMQETSDFRPRRNKYCGDCLLRPNCPEFGQQNVK